MPLGVTWGQYLRFSLAASIAMLSGSQLVHIYYRPLQDFNVFLRKELDNLPPDVQEKIEKELKDDNYL